MRHSKTSVEITHFLLQWDMNFIVIRSRGVRDIICDVFLLYDCQSRHPTKYGAEVKVLRLPQRQKQGLHRRSPKRRVPGKEFPGYDPIHLRPLS